MANSSEPAEAELAVADTIGRLMHFWGFKRPMGRLWTILYLSPEPLSAAELGEKLKMSAGGVSMALSELEQWGAVVRTWRPGQRRDYFQAETDIWKMVRRVLRDRELVLVRDFQTVLQTALRTTLPAKDSSLGRSLDRGVDGTDAVPPSGQRTQSKTDEDQAGELSYKRERLRRLADLAATGETLLEALVAGQSIDPSAISDESSS